MDTNMNNTTTTEVATRPAAGADAITTNLTIDWSDMSTEDVQALAQQALIVKAQGAWRKATIPSGDFTLKAVDYKVGSRRAPQPKDLATMIAALSPEEKAALLAKLAG
jgi:hypothetical protein